MHSILRVVFCLAVASTAGTVLETAPRSAGMMELSTKSDEFFLGFLAGPTSSAPSLLITTDRPAPVWFTVTMTNPPFERNASVEYGRIATVTIPSDARIEENRDKDKGIHIKTIAGEPISVYISDVVDIARGLQLAFPCNENFVGTEGSSEERYRYHLPPAPDSAGEQPDNSVLLLVGCRENTNVHISSPQALNPPLELNPSIVSSFSGQTLTSFAVNQQQTVALHHPGDTSNTVILASAPVTVFVGQECKNEDASLTCVRTFQQIPPSNTWGRLYLTAPIPESTTGIGYTIRSGSPPSTVVKVTCNNKTHADTYSLESVLKTNEALVVKTSPNDYCCFESPEQVQVIQYRLTDKDEDRVSIPPVEQYLNNFTLPLLTTKDLLSEDDDQKHYITLLIPVYKANSTTLGRSGVRIDGHPAPEAWTPMYCSGQVLCGYGSVVPVPSKAVVNVYHENPQAQLGVLGHSVGKSPYNYAAGYRQDNLAVPIVFIEEEAYRGSEEEGTLSLAIIRQGDLSSSTIVLFSTVEDSAIAGEDFVETDLTLQFLPRERRKLVSLPILDDLLLDDGEMFNVILTAPDSEVMLARDNVTVTIVDTDYFEVGFDMVNYTIDETTGRLEVVIKSTAPYPGPREAVLSFTTVNGTAEAPGDYLPLNIFLVFPVGTQNVTILVFAYEDFVIEEELEWFSLTLGVLSAPVDRVMITKPNATVFIEDTNTLLLELVPSSIVVEEGQTEVVVMVISTGLTERPITVFFTTSDVTATAGEDYVPLDEPLIFTLNDTSFNITLEILADSVVEEDEVFVAEFMVPEGENAVILQHRRLTVTIVNDDSVVLFFVQGALVVPEEVGEVTLTLVKNGTNARDIMVNYGALDGDAIGSEDFVPTIGTLTFTQNETSKLLTVVIIDDNVLEFPERLFVTLSTPTTDGGVVLGEPRRVSITIMDDDSVEVGFTQQVFLVTEGEESVEIAVNKTGRNSRSFDVAFTTEDGTAIEPGDYLRQTEFITFGPEETELRVKVPIVDDSVVEAVESLSVNLLPIMESVIVSSDRSQATVEIIDNDVIAIGFSEPDYTVGEGNGSLTITIARRGVATIPISVEYFTVDGSATGSEDYITIAPTLITFSGEGPELPSLTIRVREDGLPEQTETLQVKLRLPFQQRGVVLENATATVFIIDNDDVSVRFELFQYHVNESAGAVQLRLILSGETSQDVVVAIVTSDREARAPGDYSATSSTVVFAAGEAQHVIAIDIVDDSVLEETESFTVQLSPLSSGVRIDDGMTAVLIRDDDTVSVGFSTLFASIPESSGQAVVTVELEGLSEIPVTAGVATRDNTANAPDDYLSLSLTVVISPGEGSHDVMIVIFQDRVLELNEQFSVSLSSTDEDRVTLSLNRNITTIEIIDTTSDVSIGFNQTSFEFEESTRSAILTLVVNGVLGRTVSLRILTSDGTATAAEDYTALSVDVSLSAGETVYLVEVPLIDDEAVEGDEYFSVSLSTTDTALIVSTDTTTVTLKDDDRVVVSFSPVLYTVTEGEEAITLGVRMSGITLVSVNVTFRTVDDTAVGELTIADYEGIAELNLTFGPTVMEYTYDIPISIVDNDALEGMESFFAQLSIPPGETGVMLENDQATINIIDNDEVLIEFSQLFFYAIEGEPIIFLTIARKGESQINIPVEVVTQSFTATGGVDYSTTVPPVEFSTFEPVQFVQIRIFDDNIVEGDESFNVSFKRPSPVRGVLLDTTSTNVTILENDFIVVSFDPVVYVVSEDAGSVTLNITAEGASVIPLTVVVSTSMANATAQAGEDYNETVLELTLNPNDTLITATIPIVDDAEVEGLEVFSVVMAFLAEWAFAERDVALVQIVDEDELTLGFESVKYVVFEGSNRSVDVCLTKSALFSGNISLTFFTEPGSATAGLDYVPVNEKLRIEFEDLRICLPVIILDDGVVEETENFFVVVEAQLILDTISMATSITEVCIIDDDVVTVGFVDVVFTVGEDHGPVMVRVLKLGDSTAPVSVAIATEDGTARGGVDYEPFSAMLRFNPEEMEKELAITILDDSIMEGPEHFFVGLTLPMNTSGVVLGASEIRVNIEDNDSVSIEFASSVYMVREGDGTLTICLVKTGETSLSVNVEISTSPLTAQSNIDYTPLSTPLTISPERDMICAELGILDDDVALEGDEEFVVDASLPEEIPGLSLGRIAATTVTIVDDDIVEVGFVRGDYVVSEGETGAEVCVNKNRETAAAFTVSINTATSDTAQSFQDFIPLMTTLTLMPTEQVKCVTVAIVDDEIALEEDEQFRVNIHTPDEVPGLQLGAIATTFVTIIDNDVVEVELGASSYEVVEGASRVSVCLTKDKATAQDVPIILTARESIPPSAIANRDFAGGSMGVVLETEQVSVCQDVGIVDDAVFEVSENFEVTFDFPMTHPRLLYGAVRTAVVTIEDNDIIVVAGRNTTVAEEEGSVEICFTMSRVAEITISLRLTFGENSELFEAPAQGGIDFDSTPKDLAYTPGQQTACADVEIFPDTVFEAMEQFCVGVQLLTGGVSGSSRIQIPPLCGSTVTILDTGPAPFPMCKVLDSVIIEPFRDPTALLDSFTYHSSCEHVLLTTCPLFSASQLRVTIDFDPSSLDISGLAIQLNNRSVIVLKDKSVQLTNVGEAVFMNDTFTEYSSGLSIARESELVTIVLADHQIQVSRMYGTENAVVIKLLNDSPAVEVCGLCGTVRGRLLFSDRETVGDILDSSSVEEFAQSWRVNPLEQILGPQRRECGLISNDTVIGDPLFSVPLNHDPLKAFSSRHQLPHLCFEVHGASDTIFNLVSDRCTSVNALYSAMEPPATGNIISTVGIRAVDRRGLCIDIEVSLQRECAPVIKSGNWTTTASRYHAWGVAVNKHGQRVRIAVPNCENVPLVMWVLCEEVRKQRMIKFVISRGVNLRPTSHGLIGQFWNIPVQLSPPLDPTTQVGRALHIVTVSPPLGAQRRFLARLHPATWDKRSLPCYYAGSSQGGQLGEMESPRLHDPVIEGRYTEYIMAGVFETNYVHSRFDSDQCRR